VSGPVHYKRSPPAATALPSISGISFQSSDVSL
jgi:hypothetical protein